MIAAKRVSVEVQFSAVDPAVMGLLTGGAIGTPPPQTFALETYAPIKRTFWEWLRRRPRQYWYTVIPNARLDQFSHPVDSYSVSAYSPTPKADQ